MDSHPTLLFDGVCNLCNGAVNFVIDRDRRRVFRFASLQSEAGKALLRAHGLSDSSLDTVVLLEQGQAFIESDAAIRTARRLGFPWSAMVLCLAAPRFVRDSVYRFIARNRYRWFGRTEACRMPTDALRERFVP